MGSLMRFLVFPSLVQRKCQGKACNISVLLYLSSNFPMNIDSLVLHCSSPFLPMEKQDIGTEMRSSGGVWAGLRRQLPGGRWTAGWVKEGEPIQLRVAGVSSAVHL